MTQSKIVGVTGITGSGTSTVSRILQEFGGYIISADRVAHEVMRRGQPAYDKIVSTFGLCSESEIDRKALGALVFGNPEKLAILEAIVHPEVISAIHKLLENATGYPFAVIDAPLLVESGLHEICDSVWLVTAPDEVRLARIMTRDNIDEATATRRLHSRAGDDTLRPFADVVLDNSGGLQALQEAAWAKLAVLKGLT